MKKILDGKKIRFIAVDPKYVDTPYPLIAPWSSKLNTYITGQHIDPEDPDTKGNLTPDEMLGIKDIKPAGRAANFPYVINPDNTVYVFNGKSYDCRVEDNKPVNPVDYFEAYFIYAQDWVVAPNKMSVKKSKHKFYMDDKEAESRQRILLSDKRYEAEKLIRENAAIEDYKLMIYFFNMRIPGFYEDPLGLTATRLKDILLRVAEENPNQVADFFKDEYQPHILAARLVGEGVISKRHDGYYYSSLYLGVDSTALVSYISDKNNSEVVDKLKRELEQYA